MALKMHGLNTVIAPGGAEQGSLVPGAEQVPQQERGGCLSVRAGDTGDYQPVCRPAREHGRKWTHAGLGVLHRNHWQQRSGQQG